MPFDLSTSINNITNYLIEDSIIAVLLRNPIGSAFLITLIIMLVLHLSYGYKKFVRTSIYLMISLTCFLFVHYSAVQQSMEKTGAKESQREIYDGSCTTCPNPVQINPLVSNDLNINDQLKDSGDNSESKEGGAEQVKFNFEFNPIISP